jgi:hypothetical protein
MKRFNSYVDNRVKLKDGMCINNLVKTTLCKTNDLYTDYARTHTQVKRNLNMSYNSFNSLFYNDFF